MKFSFYLSLCLTFGCVFQSPENILYGVPTLWSEPINDYLIIGEKKYPNDFDTRIGALEGFDDMLWIGYGDTRVNMG